MLTATLTAASFFALLAAIVLFSWSWMGAGLGLALAALVADVWRA